MQKHGTKPDPRRVASWTAFSIARVAASAVREMADMEVVAVKEYPWRYRPSLSESSGLPESSGAGEAGWTKGAVPMSVDGAEVDHEDGSVEWGGIG